MARRSGAPLNGARYCANTNTMEVHDLDNENANCQINEIIKAGHAKPYNSLNEAKADGFIEGWYCLEQGTKSLNIPGVILPNLSAPYSGVYYHHPCGKQVRVKRFDSFPPCTTPDCPIGSWVLRKHD